MKIVINATWLMIITCILWSIYNLNNLQTQYSIDQFYPQKHKYIEDHEQIKRAFQLNDKPTYVFTINLASNDNWIMKKNIDLLKKVTNEIAGLNNTKNVISLTGIEGANYNQEEMYIGSIFERYPEKKWEEEIIKNKLLYPILIDKNLKKTLIIVEPRIDKSISKLIGLKESIEKKVLEAFPLAKLEIAGVPHIQNRLSSLIRNELFYFFIFNIIIFCILFYILFKHWTAIACALFTLFSANIFGIALLASFGIPFNALLVTLPVIISVSVMSLLIHSIHLWASKDFKGRCYLDKILISKDTIKEIFLPNILGIFTTALGFFAFTPSPIPLISNYGLTVSVVLSLVTIYAQILIFMTLPFVNPNMRIWLEKPAYWALFPLRHPFKTSACILLITLLGISQLSELNFSTRLFDDLPKNDPVRIITRNLDEGFGGLLNFELTIKSSETDFWKDPLHLHKLDQLVKGLRDIESSPSVISITDFFQGDIPKSKPQIAETFFLFSIAEKNPITSYLTEDGKETRLAIRLKDIHSSAIHDVKNEIFDLTKKDFPHLKISSGGLASYAHQINQEVSKSLIYDFWMPLAFIGLFLVIIFKSLKWALLACLPNLIPPFVLILSLGITNTEIKPGVALIFSISLGFAFNNTLYLLNRLKRLECEKRVRSLPRTLLMEANPCLLDSLIMFIGFSIFIFSDFHMNQIFGGFMIISIIAGFLADLYFLPAFLGLFPMIYRKNFKVNFNYSTAAFIFLVIPQMVNASNEANEILKKSQRLLESKDDEAMIEMKIIETNGEVKLRILSLKTLKDEGFSMLAKIESPSDVKNMAFLGNVDQEGSEKQWIYLPSSGQVRRLVTGKTKGGVLGSEIGAEDLNSEAIKNSKVKLEKADGQFYWIELKPLADSSEYSKVLTKISKSDFLPRETIYFVGDKIKKTVQFKDYKKIKNIFRAHQLVVKNHLNGRGTEVIFSNVKVNSGLSAEDFTQSQLKE